MPALVNGVSVEDELSKGDIGDGNCFSTGTTDEGNGGISVFILGEVFARLTSSGTELLMLVQPANTAVRNNKLDRRLNSVKGTLLITVVYSKINTPLSPCRFLLRSSSTHLR